ncbi:4399_t:CDS:2, partial [Ambispora leptoticha]
MLREVLDYLNIKKDGVYVDCTFGSGDNFANLEENFKRLNLKEIDGFLFDLGISSYQLAEESRGFSYRLDSPLDMRINQEEKLKAEDIINNYSSEKIISTQQLVRIVAACFPHKKNKHPARKIFQALRIFINKELENLSRALKSAFKYLALGGKVIAISYHSLEDRIVKQIFKKYNLLGKFRIITKKPLTPSKKEVSENYKSRIDNVSLVFQKNDYHDFQIEKFSDQLIITAKSDSKEEVTRLLPLLRNVFGIEIFFLAFRLRADLGELYQFVEDFFRGSTSNASTFKLDISRSNKNFLKDSLTLQKELGAIKLSGLGGLPVGSSGKALLLLSGGIDSPVAAYQLMKRGLEIIYLHFYQQTEVDSRPILTEIRHISEEKYRLIILKRMFIRLGCWLADKLKIMAIATGDSLAQVASQTLESLVVLQSRRSAELPEFISPELVEKFSLEIKEKKKNPEVNYDSSLNIGDLVKITEGTFANYEGKITAFDGRKKRVKIDIDFAGRLTPVDVPIE